MTGTDTAQVARYELEIEIAAPPERVWQALTQETDAWWLGDFRMVAPGSRVTFDARAGGELREEQADGGSLLWYTVQMVKPGEAIWLVGHTAPDWGGPATTMLKLALEKRAGGCALLVTDALVGHVSDQLCASLESGWRQLFGDGLGRYLAPAS